MVNCHGMPGLPQVALLQVQEHSSLCLSACNFCNHFKHLLFPKLASLIPTVATPLNTKPPIPLYFYPLYVKSHQDEQRTISPLEKTSVQSRSVSLRDIQLSKSNKCLSRAKGFDDYY